MDIGVIDRTGNNVYYPNDKTQKPIVGNASYNSVDNMETGVPIQNDTLSPVEMYNEQALNREQKVKGLGLGYIDATNCTWEEFKNLCNQVLESTEYDACPLEELGIVIEDETKEMDCLNYLRRWSEEQMDRGNMVGFHMGKRLSGAIANYSMDVRGEHNYIEADGVRFEAKIMEDGTSLKSGYLGSAFALDEMGGIVAFDAWYADDSTAEEPIIMIHSVGADGTPGNVYRVVLSQVDIRDATQLELFALCAHRDKQGIGDSQIRRGDGSYDFCRNLGICSMTSVEEFTEEKKDWVQAFIDKIEEIKKLLENASLNNLEKKYTIGNLSLTYKEWETMLDKMEENREKYLKDVEKDENSENTEDSSNNK